MENESSFVEVGEKAVICWDTFRWINLGEEKSRKEKGTLKFTDT